MDNNAAFAAVVQSEAGIDVMYHTTNVLSIPDEHFWQLVAREAAKGIGLRGPARLGDCI